MTEFEFFMLQMAELKRTGDFSFIKNLPPDELKSKTEMNKLTGLMYKAINTKMNNPCLVDNCEHKPILSHSLQKKLLKSIASKDNHVLQFSIDAKFNLDGNIEPIIKRIGINEASTFEGFCNTHDTEVFKPIELSIIDSTNDEHNFLLLYRSVCREYVASKNSIEVFKGVVQSLLPGMEEKNPIAPYIISELYLMVCAHTHIENMFNMSKYLLSTNTYNVGFKYYNRELDVKIPVFVSTFFALQGTEWEACYTCDITKESPLLVSMTVIPSEKTTTIFLAFQDDQEEQLSDFIYHFKNVNSSDFLVLLSDTILRNSENFYMEETYWESLPNKVEALDYFYKSTRDRMIKSDIKTNIFCNTKDC